MNTRPPPKIHKIEQKKTIFFCCDIQERFKPLISNMNSVIHVGSMLVRTGGKKSNLLNKIN